MNTVIAVMSNDGRRFGEGDKTWPILETTAQLVEDANVAQQE